MPILYFLTCHKNGIFYIPELELVLVFVLFLPLTMHLRDQFL